MSDSDRFPVIVRPPEPEEKAAELTKAVGKTVASVEFGKEQLSSGRHQGEAMIIYFTDGSSAAIMTGCNVNDFADKSAIKADEVSIDLSVVWKDDEE